MGSCFITQGAQPSYDDLEGWDWERGGSPKREGMCV